MNSSFAVSLKALKDVHKAYMNKHKELFASLKESEIRGAQGLNLGKISESSSAAYLSKLASSLIDLDQKSIIFLQNLTEKSKWMESVQNRFQIVKTQLMNTEKCIIKELKAFESSFGETTRMVKIAGSDRNFSVKTNEKIKDVLKLMVSPEVLHKCLKSQVFQVPLRLMKNFYFDLNREEPELELHSENESRKIVQHMAFLVRTVELVAGELVKVIKDSNDDLARTPELDRTYIPSSVTPSELKAIKLKINRLHNRGSLTDEEALNMLGKISVIPISPDHEASGFAFKAQELSNDYDDDIDPVFDKQKHVFGESFSKDLGKKTKTVKRLSKRCSTPAKKIVRNTSLPKAILYNKISSKEKSKQVKLKSKSPHSFM